MFFWNFSSFSSPWFIKQCVPFRGLKCGSSLEVSCETKDEVSNWDLSKKLIAPCDLHQWKVSALNIKKIKSIFLGHRKIFMKGRSAWTANKTVSVRAISLAPAKNFQKKKGPTLEQIVKLARQHYCIKSKEKMLNFKHERLFSIWRIAETESETYI